jgi:hypothetical protein
VGSRRLTAWPMAQPLWHLNTKLHSGKHLTLRLPKHYRDLFRLVLCYACVSVFSDSLIEELRTSYA